MILIDSSGWIEFFGDGKNAPKFSEYIKQAGKETHITPSVVVYEVFKKLSLMVGEEKALTAIAYMFNATTVIPLDGNQAVASADTSIRFKLGMADAIIKTIADARQAKIVTSDSDLKPFSNVIHIPKA